MTKEYKIKDLYVLRTHSQQKGLSAGEYLRNGRKLGLTDEQIIKTAYDSQTLDEAVSGLKGQRRRRNALVSIAGRALKKILTDQAEDQTRVVRTWFSDNYGSLIYDQDGKIPYPIVRAMRTRFSQWALGTLNSFDEPIENIIEEAAKSSRLDAKEYQDYRAIWVALKYKK